MSCHCEGLKGEIADHRSKVSACDTSFRHQTGLIDVMLKLNEARCIQSTDQVLALSYSRDGRLDLLIGDTPILDYYRANDPGCTLRTVDVIEEDNYAVGMTKGLRLQVSIDYYYIATRAFLASGISD